MHLRNCPLYYSKGDQRVAVYYTVQERELIAEGWTQESEQAAGAVVTQEDDAAAGESQPSEPQDEPVVKDIYNMTKPELIAYAEMNGIEFKQYATKSEILEACQAAQNG